MEVASSAGVGVVVILDVFCRSLDAQVFFLLYVARRCLRVTYLASREERYRRKGTLLVGGVLTGGHVVFSFTAIICTETPPRLPAIAHFVFIHIRLIRVRIRTVLVRMPVAISSVLQQLSHSIWFFRINYCCYLSCAHTKTAALLVTAATRANVCVRIYFLGVVLP